MHSVTSRKKSISQLLSPFVGSVGLIPFYTWGGMHVLTVETVFQSTLEVVRYDHPELWITTRLRGECFSLSMITSP
jgi:hypothetical protein